ncbi:peptidylprolyl isomerase [Fodinicurvata fenggangensis]|uniref:peptidylprolyl isomerase n=1 Tax=Fodinicurvata fenggangensis TaxID=1121830 RepID=UPI00055929CF|nr:peptidylprolyl isomerase [Fodinicurvata fenggangensis]
MRKIFALALSAFLMVAHGTTQEAEAQNTLSAAAVVNDQVISQLDLDQRLKLSLLSSGLPNNEETRQNLAPQVLRQLIDERLQRQEAERLALEVPEAEVEAAVEEIAQRNGSTVEEFDRMLEQNGIAPSTLRQQVRTTIAWNRVLSARVVPEVQITQEEIEFALEQFQQTSNQSQVRVAEIFLPFDSPSERGEVRELAEQIFREVRRGADFRSLARQFSQSPTAARGGDLGWVLPTELDPDVAREVEDMGRNDLAGPIEAVNGYYIIAVIDRRRINAQGEVERVAPREPEQPRRTEPQGPTVEQLRNARLRLTQIIVEAPEGEEEQAAENLSERVQGLQGCEQANQLAEEIGMPGSGDMGRVVASEMPEQLQNLLLRLPVGQPSPPLGMSGAVSVLFVCERVDSNGNPVTAISPQQRQAPPAPDVAAQFQSNIDPRPMADDEAEAPEVEEEQESAENSAAEDLMSEDMEPITEQPEMQEERSELEQQVAESLRREQINRKSDRYLRDLRRSANIDIRM